MFSKIYSYPRLRSEFDGRNILVDVPQECCGTPAEQAQAEGIRGCVPKSGKNQRLGSRSEEIHVRCSKTEEKVLRGEIGTDGRGKSVKERGREKRKQSDEAIQKSAFESKG